MLQIIKHVPLLAIFSARHLHRASWNSFLTVFLLSQLNSPTPVRYAEDRIGFIPTLVAYEANYWILVTKIRGKVQAFSMTALDYENCHTIPT